VKGKRQDNYRLERLGAIIVNLDCIGHVEQPASIVLPTGLDTTQVILIVAGCLAFLVLMCVLKICCCEVQKKGKELPVYPEEKIRDDKS
jgi:hypothetical protein